MIPLYKVFMPDGIDEELKNILYSGNIAYGKYARQFENELIDYLGNPLLLTTNNNNNALLVALTTIGLTVDDEVIAAPISCLASNQPIVSLGAKIVWADIDPKTGTLDPESVLKKITPKTKAILHYHWCGYPGYIDEINEVGKQKGIYVIEDAIEAFGAECNGNKIGNTNSDITCFSFQPVRLPTTIDGGAITFNNKDLYEKAKLVRDYGIDRTQFRDIHGEISSECDIKYPGYNALMNEISGYIGVQQMKHVSNLLMKQRNNAKQYDKTHQELLVNYLIPRKNVLPNYWVYTVFSNQQMHSLLEYREKGLYASKVHLRNDCYSCFGKKDDTLIGVKEFCSKTISIPSGWWINYK